VTTGGRQVPTFKSFDGLELHYEDRGDGPPAVLLHGFAANSDLNWVRPGVAGALLDAGRRVIMLDARGHGLSEKPHEPAAYENEAMASDVSALADELDLELFDAVGYSMGARTTAFVAGREERVRSAVLGGVGATAFARRPEFRTAVADALLASDSGAVSGEETARGFRAFADATGADRQALAAVMRAGSTLTAGDLAAISVPVLIVTGTADDLVGDPEPVAAGIPDARVVRCPGDHLSAPSEPAFAAAVVAFLADQEDD
jgi:pimeloyl-ACP methyl ester carboxylesterase